jgi:ankyrin repeat protein
MKPEPRLKTVTAGSRNNSRWSFGCEGMTAELSVFPVTIVVALILISRSIGDAGNPGVHPIEFEPCARNLIDFGAQIVDKRSFIDSVRTWDWRAVEKALGEEPSLAEYTDQNGMAPLHHCARTNPNKSGLKVRDSVKTAQALISRGADPNKIRIIVDEEDRFPATPLWFAVAWGKNPTLARLLLENGATADDNAVWSAIWDQDLEMAKLLSSYGGNIDVVINGQTPLLATVKAKRLKLLKWLVTNGANINFRDAARPYRLASRGNEES